LARSHAHIGNIVIESSQSPFEEIKSAASYALPKYLLLGVPQFNFLQPLYKEAIEYHKRFEER